VQNHVLAKAHGQQIGEIKSVLRRALVSYPRQSGSNIVMMKDHQQNWLVRFERQQAVLEGSLQICLTLRIKLKLKT
jgi:hypothetical protein